MLLEFVERFGVDGSSGVCEVFRSGGASSARSTTQNYPKIADGAAVKRT